LRDGLADLFDLAMRVGLAGDGSGGDVTGGDG
jgi:hypothetical protein